VRAALTELQQVDVTPFEYALRAGVGSVMSAFVAYPNWDRAGRAASFSPEILGYLRDTLNFGGLVVTDALIMAGARAAQPVPAATVGAVGAGCDALLYPENFTSVIAALDRAVGAEISAARADQALVRYDGALAGWADLPDQGSRASRTMGRSRTGLPTGRRIWCAATRRPSTHPSPCRWSMMTWVDHIRSGRETCSTRPCARPESLWCNVQPGTRNALS